MAEESAYPLAAARRSELDPAMAVGLRLLRVANRRQAQELDMLKLAIAIFSVTNNR